MLSQIPLLDNLNTTFYNHIEVMKEFKNKIEKIYKCIDNHEISKVIIELNDFKNNIDKVISDIEKNCSDLNILKFNLLVNFKENTNIKKNKDWTDYISFSLINTLQEGKDKKHHYYQNILDNAAIFGNNGLLWAKSEKLELKKKEIEKLNELFYQKNNNNKMIEISGEEFQIINYEFKTLMDLKKGDIGGTIAKTETAYILGFFNSKKKCKVDGKEENQNHKFCNMAVKDLALRLGGIGI